MNWELGKLVIDADIVKYIKLKAWQGQVFWMGNTRGDKKIMEWEPVSKRNREEQKSSERWCWGGFKSDKCQIFWRDLLKTEQNGETLLRRPKSLELGCEAMEEEENHIHIKK